MIYLKVNMKTVAMKALLVAIWTWFLNFLCSKGHIGVSWFLVIIPMVIFALFLIVISNIMGCIKNRNKEMFANLAKGETLGQFCGKPINSKHPDCSDYIWPEHCNCDKYPSQCQKSITEGGFFGTEIIKRNKCDKILKPPLTADQKLHKFCNMPTNYEHPDCSDFVWPPRCNCEEDPSRCKNNYGNTDYFFYPSTCYKLNYKNYQKRLKMCGDGRKSNAYVESCMRNSDDGVYTL